MHTYDVLFIADHFVMVTTVEMYKSIDKRDVEKEAWARLADAYSEYWVADTKSHINQVSVEDVGTSVPEVGDITDTGTEVSDE